MLIHSQSWVQAFPKTLLKIYQLPMRELPQPRLAVQFPIHSKAFQPESPCLISTLLRIVSSWPPDHGLQTYNRDSFSRIKFNEIQNPAPKPQDVPHVSLWGIDLTSPMTILDGHWNKMDWSHIKPVPFIPSLISTLLQHSFIITVIGQHKHKTKHYSFIMS